MFDLESSLSWQVSWGFVTSLLFLLAALFAQMSIRRFGVVRQFHEKRIRYVQRSMLTLVLTLYVLTEAVIWGIDLHGISVFASSIFALIGIAFFASWSVLSNITAAALIFFFFPYRIGDAVQIVDGDHSVAGQIIDMTLFWVKIEDAQSGITCYPNNLILQKPVKRIS